MIQLSLIKSQCNITFLDIYCQRVVWQSHVGKVGEIHKNNSSIYFFNLTEKVALRFKIDPFLTKSKTTKNKLSLIEDRGQTDTITANPIQPKPLTCDVSYGHA